MMGRSSRLEQQRKVFLELGLITFDREMVMRLTFDQIDRQLALRQQGIGADRLTGNRDGIEYRREHPDFIGPFGDFLAFYGECADFFWV